MLTQGKTIIFDKVLGIENVILLLIHMWWIEITYQYQDINVYVMYVIVKSGGNFPKKWHASVGTVEQNFFWSSIEQNNSKIFSKLSIYFKAYNELMSDP